MLGISLAFVLLESYTYTWASEATTTPALQTSTGLIDANDPTMSDDGFVRTVTMNLTTSNENYISVIKKQVTGSATEVPGWHSDCTPLGNSYHLIVDTRTFYGETGATYEYEISKYYRYRSEVFNRWLNGTHDGLETRWGQHWESISSRVVFNSAPLP